MTQTSSITAQLIADCKQGKQAAFNAVYRECARGVYNAIWRIVRNNEEAEDLCQETFISAFTSMEKYRGDASLFGWIKKIGINKSLNAIKKNRLELTEQDVANNISVEEEENEWTALQLEVGDVKEKLNELPEGFRLVLTLYLLEDYSHKEIATALGISESTSKTQYLRGKKRLKELLMTSIN